MQNGFTQTTENIFISMNWWVSEAGLVWKFPLRGNLPDLNSSSAFQHTAHLLEPVSHCSHQFAFEWGQTGR